MTFEQLMEYAEKLRADLEAAGWEMVTISREDATPGEPIPLMAVKDGIEFAIDLTVL